MMHVKYWVPLTPLYDARITMGTLCNRYESLATELTLCFRCGSMGTLC